MTTSGPDAAGADEAALLARARDGDQDAFGHLVAGYQSELRSHCYRMLGSVHDAEDALQDALLRAWQGLGGFEGRSSIRSWLYSIATNTAIDRAVLVLRDVMAFSGAEVSRQLGRSVPSVYSALQRARATLQDGLPGRSQQAVLRAAGDQHLLAIARQYAPRRCSTC
jgi:RNA polymerase sigma-70 factor, ECF subfamily